MLRVLKFKKKVELFIAFFFIQEQGMFLSFLLTLIPDNYVEQTQNAIQESIRILSRYFNGLLLQMLLITIYMLVMLSIFGIKNAFNSFAIIVP